jgi:drug/metabolite transporter (DMT)-like permease
MKLKQEIKEEIAHNIKPKIETKMQMKWFTNSIVVCIMASICCALWGSAFPCVKIGYQMLAITPDEINAQILYAGMRFTLAGIITIIIGSILAKRILVPKRKAIPQIINLSFLQTIVQYLFFYIGLSNTTGVKASIVQGTNVFVALLVASVIFRQEILSRRKLIGCIIGFIGVVIINVNGTGLGADIKLTGEGFIFLSTVAYAFSSVLLKQYSKTEQTILLSGYQFLVGGFVMMIVGALMGARLEMYTLHSIGILLYLALVSAIAYALWGVLLTHNPISKVAVYGFMTPVLGVILSAILLGEHEVIGFKSMIALLLVSGGIFIVNSSGSNSETIRYKQDLEKVH